MWAMAQEVPLTPETATVDSPGPFSRGWDWAAAAPPPRGGATRDGVQRLPHPRVPRARQAPDGPTEGGSHPTASSRITRRLVLAPALPMTKGQREEAQGKKSVANP